jgi:hypothetical protein
VTEAPGDMMTAWALVDAARRQTVGDIRRVKTVSELVKIARNQRRE